MSVLTLLENIFLSPLKLIFEFIFQITNNTVRNPGLSIIALSFLMNILVLPLYMRADAMQEEARDIENKLNKGVAHIKKSFSGDEKMMIMQTYYRQNNYKPTDALKGSISLLLEIPFFMVAYQFLSNLDALNGATLGPIKDLGAPDGLLVIGGLAINVLPILMTLINVVSSSIYLKGFPLKTKLQLYGIAIFFLVFLYTSPAGLVFYWTLNNIFSLIKNTFYKLKNPKKVLKILLSIVGIAFIILGILFYQNLSPIKKAFIIILGALFQVPILLSLIKSKIKHKKIAPNQKLFLAGSIFLTVLIGVLIPSNFIAASPQEFIDVTYFHNPLWYIVSTLCIAIGTFLIWLRIFYGLATPKVKVLFEKLVWILSGVMIVNYMFFGTDLGILSPTLQYENGLGFSKIEQLLNIAVMFMIAVVFYFIVSRWGKIITSVLLSAVIALGAMSVVNIVKINTSVNSINSEKTSDIPTFQLSTEGKNVIVLTLDRAMGEFVPYIFNEKPELKEKFDGFTYYSNTISHGPNTNFGIPTLSGGYEYTPVEMNKRDTELLMDKHNEALKVMPVLFNNNNYNVTVCDPSYANYQWIPDLSIYNEYPDIKTYSLASKFLTDEQKSQEISFNYRNFFCFSLMKTIPLTLQRFIYDNGTYNRADTVDSINYTYQNITSLSVAEGYNSSFLNYYNVLDNMSNMSNITNEPKNTFLFMFNDITHIPTLLQEPDYIPSYKIDNTVFDSTNSKRFTIDEETLKVENIEQMTHYQINMAALLKVADWLDYLRDNDVFDNTRIIIVSDHGHANHHIDKLTFDDGRDHLKNVEVFYPLLLVKDFNSTGFTTSDEFMTNADVPTLATQGIIKNPINPFTGKEINNDEKYAHEQMVILSPDWNIEKNNGNSFLPSRWASISNNLWDRDNWKFYEKEIVLKEHKLPEN